MLKEQGFEKYSGRTTLVAKTFMSTVFNRPVPEPGRLILHLGGESCPFFGPERCPSRTIGGCCVRTLCPVRRKLTCLVPPPYERPRRPKPRPPVPTVIAPYKHAAV